MLELAHMVPFVRGFVTGLYGVLLVGRWEALIMTL